ncbi:hypothetical protein C0989_011412 [Termitomyces sp. Mn162]|nr:hypothetical protein C0989_011412 [Termitomyces sp. Mn162]
MSEIKLWALKDYFNNMLSKGFICPLISTTGAPVLFILQSYIILQRKAGAENKTTCKKLTLEILPTPPFPQELTSLPTQLPPGQLLWPGSWGNQVRAPPYLWPAPTMTQAPPHSSANALPASAPSTPCPASTPDGGPLASAPNCPEQRLVWPMPCQGGSCVYGSSLSITEIKMAGAVGDKKQKAYA